MLLSLLMPVMAISGGCLSLLFPKGIYPQADCRRVLVVDDPSYLDPSYATFWNWFPRGEFMDPTSVVTSSIQADLRNYLKNDARATARSFFSSLGMSCRSAGSDAQCERTIPAYYVCEHVEPRPDDYKVRYDGRLRIVVWVGENDIVKGADSVVMGRGGAPRCPDKRE
jgi:hypothetical protein